MSEQVISQNLEDYQWKNRILLLVDSEPDSKALLSQLQEFNSETRGLIERDLIIFRVTPGTVYTSKGKPLEIDAPKIYNKYRLGSDFSGTLLIGKDGGSKLKKPFEVTTETIFSLIDGMPMRRAEMRQNGKHWEIENQ